MIEKIRSIKQALESECYLPALALALTLPDICGQIEYPQYQNKKGKRLVGRQYEDWFDNWVDHCYLVPTGWTEDGQRVMSPYFTGEMCYKLRCSFLHSGNADIKDFGEREDDQNRYSYNFELCVNGCDSVGLMWGSPQIDNNKIDKEKSVRINVIDLCNNLCTSAEEYYEHKGKECFNDNSIKLLDIEAFVNKLNR